MAAVIPPILLTPSIGLGEPDGSIPSASWSSPPRRRSAKVEEHFVCRTVFARTNGTVPLVLAVVLVAVALVVAPEQPHDQEAICQRHSGEAACRVW
jgi:hypothetical protein